MDRKTKFFNTGLLPSNIDKLRIEQGLPPLELANLCAYDNTGKNSFKAGDPPQKYPLKHAELKYDLEPIKKSCNCLKANESY